MHECENGEKRMHECVNAIMRKWGKMSECLNEKSLEDSKKINDFLCALFAHVVNNIQN